MADQSEKVVVPAEGATQAPAEEGGEKKLSKSQLKKLEKQAAKEQKKEAQKQQHQQHHAEEQDDPCAQYYGDLELIQSQKRTDRKWTPIKAINETLEGQIVLVRARVNDNILKGNMVFLVLREDFYTIQAVAFKHKDNPTMSKQFIKYLGKVTKESIIDIEAKVVKPPEEVKSTTQKVELAIVSAHTVTRSQEVLPFQLVDASRRVEASDSPEDDVPEVAAAAAAQGAQTEERKAEEAMPTVGQKTRLDNRILDIRTPAKQAIFRLKGMIAHYFREFFIANDFVEINTPKLIGGKSEGGTNVFELQYFGQKACLAQSPQLYKQMCVMGDFKRVFEIAPVFRAENSLTHRHMCEFVGIDLEMEIKEHYFELLEVMGEMFYSVFRNIEQRCGKELEAIRQQFPFEPFVCAYPIVKVDFREGCRLLAERGVNQDPLQDLDTPTEKALGAIIKEKYNTDFYMLYRYPKSARPFYTMLDKEDPNYTLSYDFFMRGEEITSGAQRIHEPELLTQRARECGIEVNTLKDYINAFRFGAYPHGGCGIGLDRVLFLYCNLHNIRNAILFPRDPKRLYP